MTKMSKILVERDFKQALPKDLGRALSLLKSEFVNVTNPVILNILLNELMQMFTYKKITIDEAGIKVLPNWYSLILMGSGEGKDRMVKRINNHLLKPYEEWRKNDFEEKFKIAVIEYEAMQKQEQSSMSTNNVNIKRNEGEKNNVVRTDCPF